MGGGRDDLICERHYERMAGSSSRTATVGRIYECDSPVIYRPYNPALANSIGGVEQTNKIRMELRASSLSHRRDFSRVAATRPRFFDRLTLVFSYFPLSLSLSGNRSPTEFHALMAIVRASDFLVVAEHSGKLVDSLSPRVFHDDRHWCMRNELSICMQMRSRVVN